MTDNLHTNANMGFLNHGYVIGSIANGSGDRLERESFDEFHHLNYTNYISSILIAFQK